MKISTKQIALTAMFLALLIAVQQFKNLSTLITGPFVNAILIITTLYLGVFSGLTVAVLSSLFAFLVNPSKLLLALPLMTPTVMVANAIIVLAVYIFRKKNLIVGMTIGSILKTAFLWIAANYVLIPIFGSGLPDPMKLALKTAFSYNQLITAAAGSVIAYIIWHSFLKAKVKI